MPLPPLPTVARIAWLHKHFGQDVVNTLHFEFPTELDFAMLFGFATKCQNAWLANMIGRFSFDLTYVGLEARQAVQGGGLGVDIAPLLPAPGGMTGNSHDPARATALAITTERTGRSFAGTMFLGGLPDNQVFEGLIDPDYRAACVASLNSVLLELAEEAATALPVVVSYFGNKVQRPTPLRTRIRLIKSVTTRPANVSSRAVEDG